MQIDITDQLPGGGTETAHSHARATRVRESAIGLDLMVIAVVTFAAWHVGLRAPVVRELYTWLSAHLPASLPAPLFILTTLLASGFAWRRVRELNAHRRRREDAERQLEERDTELQRMRRQLERMAYQDALTGLPNRRLLELLADKAIARVQREGGVVGVLHIDLVWFRRINDSLGHVQGDEVLRQAARRFQACVRSMDTLARTGGDEFAVLLVGLHSPDDATAAARNIRATLQRPFTVGDAVFYLDARIGVATYPGPATTAEELISLAELALHRGSSGDHISISDVADLRDARADLALEEKLRQSLQTGEGFLLHYQPVFRLDAERPVGVEALIRWQQLDGRMLGPADFLPLAERCRLMPQVDRWVIREALRHLQEWGSAGPEWVAVNVAADTFDDSTFTAFVAQTLEASGVTPARLTLEITEHDTMRDPGHATVVLAELKNLGVRIAIDDFGQGYSSLSYLRTYPADMLKIDRFFVDGVGTNPAHEWIVQGVIALAKGLDLQLIAEGIETRNQQEWLVRHGCELAQGYHLARPMTAEGVAELFARPATHKRPRRPYRTSRFRPSFAGAKPTGCAVPGDYDDDRLAG